MFSLHKRIYQIEGYRQALFVGFFGPIGVSAVFYLYVSLEFLHTIKDATGAIREDAERLSETMIIVIWFLAICSIIVHGLSVPLGKVGYHLPRTISSAVMSRDREDPEPFQIPNRSEDDDRRRRLRFRQRDPGASGTNSPPTPTVFRIGGSVVPLRDVTTSPDLSKRPERQDFVLAQAASGRQPDSRDD